MGNPGVHWKRMDTSLVVRVTNRTLCNMENQQTGVTDVSTANSQRRDAQAETPFIQQTGSMRNALLRCMDTDSCVTGMQCVGMLSPSFRIALTSGLPS